MAKRFTLRKIHQYAYARQGWAYKDCGFVYAIYDREWRKNFEAVGGTWRFGFDDKEYKYIDNARSKEVAQYWADWLNTNCSDKFGRKLCIPPSVFAEGLKLYK